MEISKTALSAYLLFCFFSIIGDVFKWDALQLFTIPLVLPTLFFYYFQETEKLNILVCLFILSNFVGDFLGLMGFEDEIYYIIPPFFISNLLMVIVLVKNIEKFKFNFLNISALIIIGSFLGFILVEFLELFSFGEGNIQMQVCVFGIQLIILALLASYNIIWKITISNIFLMMSVSCVLISDVFYIIFNYQNQLVVLDSLHFACQLFSYFFFIKYVLVREQEIKKMI